MTMDGMNVEAVRGLGRSLQRQADQLDQVKTAVDQIVRQARHDWRGKNSERFQRDWEQSHRRRLADAAEKVRGLGQSALNNASEQEAASGGAGGAPGAGNEPHVVMQTGTRVVTDQRSVTVEDGHVVTRNVNGVYYDDRTDLTETRYDAQGNPISIHSETSSGASMQTTTSSAVGADGLTGEVAVDMNASVEARETETRDLGDVDMVTGYRLSTGADASASVQGRVGLDGAQASVGFDAMAGASGGLEAKLQNDFFSAGVEGGLRGGVGATGKVTASLTMDKVGFSCRLGAVLGVGANVGFSISVSPKAIFDKLSGR